MVPQGGGEVAGADRERRRPVEAPACVQCPHPALVEHGKGDRHQDDGRRPLDRPSRRFEPEVGCRYGCEARTRTYRRGRLTGPEGRPLRRHG
jgi:hypothetical protein